MLKIKRLGSDKMKITELKNCIEEMRKCYNFDDNKTEIRIGRLVDMGNGMEVSVYTTDKNGTHIEMTRRGVELHCETE